MANPRKKRAKLCATRITACHVVGASERISTAATGRPRQCDEKRRSDDSEIAAREITMYSDGGTEVIGVRENMHCRRDKDERTGVQGARTVKRLGGGNAAPGTRRMKRDARG